MIFGAFFIFPLIWHVKKTEKISFSSKNTIFATHFTARFFCSEKACPAMNGTQRHIE